MTKRREWKPGSGWPKDRKKLSQAHTEEGLIISLLAWTHTHTKKNITALIFSPHMNHSVTNVQKNYKQTDTQTEKLKSTFASLAGDTRWKITWSTKTKENSTFTHSYTPIQSFNPHVINVMTNGGVKQLYIVQFIFVTMILPSQVLFPFINIRRRALQIRKCSEISASICPYIYYICIHIHPITEIQTSLQT